MANFYDESLGWHTSRPPLGLSRLWRDRRDADEVLPDLFVGSVEAGEAQRLRARKVSHVLVVHPSLPMHLSAPLRHQSSCPVVPFSWLRRRSATCA